MEFSNDLDYFLFNDAPDDAALLAWCREIEKTESALLGIDVEIKTLRAESIGDPSRSMMFADLVAGHVVVAGNAGFLQKMRDSLDFSRIEPEEATRLLWNRGSGMFFSRCRMGEGGDKKFVIRNHAKLKLALGDAWLCLHGAYTSKCRERGERLAKTELPANLAAIRAWHREGVDFKFKPFADGMTWEELDSESGKLIEAWGVVYLAAETKRLKRNFSGFSEYLAVSRLLPGGHLKNLVLALRDRLRRGASLKPLGDYPRAALMRALPCLLGLTSGGEAEAARFLPKPEGDPSRFRAWEPVYSKWWTYYA
ncbi:hypothetical protein JIN84_20170 [Luteolibacter yonseiensis]|uniref:Uncharacterized protein n=1 Tax=Luteolibacter yonseiensis TaxID=1144680 RepID=A0A934R6N3_9BACT|nr:hypothetical protein [Luteolibacter yonseiensis]MBK1817949.1 hypothetical protein [Luteolibacter yonseiensis]